MVFISVSSNTVEKVNFRSRKLITVLYNDNYLMIELLLFYKCYFKHFFPIFTSDKKSMHIGQSLPNAATLAYQEKFLELVSGT